jgi:hypothetical protein
VRQRDLTDVENTFRSLKYEFVRHYFWHKPLSAVPILETFPAASRRRVLRIRECARGIISHRGLKTVVKWMLRPNDLFQMMPYPFPQTPPTLASRMIDRLLTSKIAYRISPSMVNIFP